MPGVRPPFVSPAARRTGVCDSHSAWWRLYFASLGCPREFRGTEAGRPAFLRELWYACQMLWPDPARARDAVPALLPPNPGKVFPERPPRGEGAEGDFCYYCATCQGFVPVEQFPCHLWCAPQDPAAYSSTAPPGGPLLPVAREQIDAAALHQFYWDLQRHTEPNLPGFYFIYCPDGECASSRAAWWQAYLGGLTGSPQPAAVDPATGLPLQLFELQLACAALWQRAPCAPVDVPVLVPSAALAPRAAPQLQYHCRHCQQFVAPADFTWHIACFWKKIHSS